jgi:hypothetical protein
MPRGSRRQQQPPGNVGFFVGRLWHVWPLTDSCHACRKNRTRRRHCVDLREEPAQAAEWRRHAFARPIVSRFDAPRGSSKIRRACRNRFCESAVRETGAPGARKLYGPLEPKGIRFLRPSEEPQAVSRCVRGIFWIDRPRMVSFLIAAFCRPATSLSHSEQMGWLVGAVGTRNQRPLRDR